MYKENDKSRGYCYKCKDLVSITFKYIDYKYKNIIIPDILQGVCDHCGMSISLPHQSSYDIKKYRKDNKIK